MDNIDGVPTERWGLLHSLGWSTDNFQRDPTHLKCYFLVSALFRFMWICPWKEVVDRPWKMTRRFGRRQGLGQYPCERASNFVCLQSANMQTSPTPRTQTQWCTSRVLTMKYFHILTSSRISSQIIETINANSCPKSKWVKVWVTNFNLLKLIS